MRQNLLDSLRPAVALPPSATVSVQAVQQCRQREQIRDTERRPARRHPHKRIHRRSTGKSLTNAAQHPVITRVMDPSHTLHRPDLDQLELASVKRMKQVRHTEVAPLNASKGCSWILCPRMQEAASATPGGAPGGFVQTVPHRPRARPGVLRAPAGPGRVRASIAVCRFCHLELRSSRSPRASQSRDMGPVGRCSGLPGLRQAFPGPGGADPGYVEHRPGSGAGVR